MNTLTSDEYGYDQYYNPNGEPDPMELDQTESLADWYDHNWAESHPYTIGELMERMEEQREAVD